MYSGHVHGIRWTHPVSTDRDRNRQEENVNGLTRDIIKRLDVTTDEALQIQRFLEEEHLVDYSEASMKEINHAIDEAHEIWLCGSALAYYSKGIM
jgi:hypothetical protein